MGFCFSCCRGRRDKQADAERQPLLRSDTDSLKKTAKRSPYEKVTDALAALNSGKLPNQQQLDVALRALLRSDLLQVERGENRDGGALDEAARRVVEDAREVVEAFMQVGLEKNHDNRMQDLLYQLRQLSARSIPVDFKSFAEVQVSRETTDNLQTAASAIPSQDELASDTIALISSLRTLANLLLTSSAFRLIVGDLLHTARQLAADTAVQVRKVAEAVEQVSETVETTVRPDSDADGLQPQPVVTKVETSRPVSPGPTDVESKPPKEVALDRIEDIFRRAQASPKYNSALRTLLYVFKKYAERVSLASTAISQATQPSSGEPSIEVIAPVIVPDPRFSRGLKDIQILFERFAGGKSHEPILQSLFKTVHDVTVAPANGESNDIQIFFKEIGTWLDTALADPSFVGSQAGRDAASRLYDEGHTRLSQDTQLSENIHHLLDEVNAFADAIMSDRSTNKLSQVVDNLQSDLSTLFGRTAESGIKKATHWRTTILHTALGWVLPRFLRAIRTLPMPRVEYVSTTSDGTRIAAAIDALLLSAEEALIPDVLSFQEFAEVRVEVDETVGAAEVTNPNSRLLSARKNTNQEILDSTLRISHPGNGVDEERRMRNRKKTNVTATSRVRVHVEGLRVVAHDVGYFASYTRNSWLGYSDEGLLSVEIGRGRHHRGEGLTVDVELETASDSHSSVNGAVESEKGKLFRVLDVHTAIPGLALHIAHSKHWILNSILAPLAGPIGRALGTRVLNSQIQSTLETFEKVLREIKHKADEKAEKRGDDNGQVETNASDWWGALIENFNGTEQEGPEDDDGDEADDVEPEIYTETHTEATLTGVVRTTIEQPEPDADGEAPPTTENALAVGLGAQLLPGKGEPTALGIERESPQEAAQEVAATAREAAEDIQGKVQNLQEGAQSVAQDGLEGATRVRRIAEEGRERMVRQERRENRRGGWRSHAFDL